VNRARLLSVAGSVFAAMAALTPLLAARARPIGKVGWCAADRLYLSAASGPHTAQPQTGGTLLWFLQLRHHGPSACMVENRLTLLRAETVSGQAMKLNAHSPAFGPTRKPLVLRNRQRAFLEVEDPATWTLSPIKGCKERVLLTFSLPHGNGELRARPPVEVAMCPAGEMLISETFSATVFSQYTQGAKQLPSGYIGSNV
jgi:hypothetical protein